MVNGLQLLVETLFEDVCNFIWFLEIFLQVTINTV